MALGGCVALSSLRARALMGGMVVLPTTAAPFTSTAATAMFTFMMMVTMVIMVIMVIVMTSAMFSIMMMVTMVIMVIMVIMVMTMMIMMVMMICLHRSRTKHGSIGSAQASSSVGFIVSVHGLLHCVMRMFAARRENGGVGGGGRNGVGRREECHKGNHGKAKVFHFATKGVVY